MDSASGGSPVQIIRVISERRRNADQGHHRLHLDEKKLTEIFAKYKYEKCIIVSIVGPAQSGKSFFANWCLKRLQSNDSKWNKIDRISGFPSKATDSEDETETRGFVMWSEPFPVEMDEGTVYVFLMDTQGFVEENVADMMTFVGFNMLVSWGVIFNCLEVDLPVFESLGPVLKFLKQKPLNKMVFLIQQTKDIESLQPAKQRSLEKRNLDELLDSEIEVNGSTESLKDIVQGSFIETSLYLLPPPGDCVGEANYDGQCSGLRPKYRAKLKSAVEEIFILDSDRNYTTGSEIIIQVSNIVKMFEGKNITESDLEDIKRKTDAEGTIESAIGNYSRQMAMFLGNTTKFDSVELKKRHDEISEAVITECQLNGNVSVKLLFEGIEKAYCGIVEEQKCKQREIVEEALDSVTGSFKNLFNVRVRESGKGSGKTRMDLVDDVISELKTDAKAKFKRAVTEIEKTIAKPYKGQLKETLRTMAANLKREARKAEDSSMSKLMDESVARFKSLTNNDSEGFLSIVEFQEMLRSAEDDTISHFKLYNSNTEQLVQLRELIGQERSKISAKNDKRREEFVVVVNRQVEQLLRDLTNECNFAIDNKEVTNHEELIEFFRKCENSKKQKIMSIYRTENQRTVVISKWKEVLGEELDKLNNKLSISVNVAKRTVEKLKDNAISDYIESISGALNGEVLLDEEELLANHEQVKNATLNSLKRIAKQTAYSGWLNVFDEFEKSVDDEFVQLKLINSNNIEAVCSTAELAIPKLVENYNQIFRDKIKTIVTEKEYSDLHESTNNDLKKQLTELMVRVPQSIKNTLFELLEEKVQGAKKEANEGWQLYRDVRLSKMRGLLDDARRYYETEMDTFMKNSVYHKPNVLVEFHKTTVDNALELAKKKCGDSTSEMKREFVDQLHKLYEVLKAKNLLNYDKNTAIGIDLGTTNCCVCIVQGGRIVTIPINGYMTTPSYLWLDETSEEEKVGIEPKMESYIYAKNTIFDAKRLIGRHFNDRDIQKDIAIWPFEVIDVKGLPHVKVVHNNADLILAPDEVSARILKKLKESAELYLGEKVTDAVITVPAYFQNNQRQMTRAAGQAAGLNVLRIIDEPVAAAMAFKLNLRTTAKLNVMVYDFGGGTLDVAILEIRHNNIEIKAKAGDNHLGGEDIDNNMFEACINHLMAETGVDLRKDHATRQRLLRVCEEHKKHLSSNKSTNIVVDNIATGHNFAMKITRKRFNELNEDVYRRAMIPVLKCLEEAKMDKKEIDEIVLVGGTTWIPKIQRMLIKYFNKQLNKSVKGDIVVAEGAAIQAVVSKSDQCDDKYKSIHVRNVTTYNIGVKVASGELSVVIPKTVNIPVEKKSIFTTASDYQTIVKFEIFEGENLEEATKNRPLGSFELNNLPPDLKGRLELVVIMNMNDEGILKVTATCTRNNETSEIVLTELGGE